MADQFWHLSQPWSLLYGKPPERRAFSRRPRRPEIVRWFARVMLCAKMILVSTFMLVSAAPTFDEAVTKPVSRRRLETCDDGSTSDPSSGCCAASSCPASSGGEPCCSSCCLYSASMSSGGGGVTCQCKACSGTTVVIDAACTNDGFAAFCACHGCTTCHSVQRPALPSRPLCDGCCGLPAKLARARMRFWQ